MSEAQKLSQKLAVTRAKRLTVSGRKLVWECRLCQMRHSLGLTLRDITEKTGVSSAVLSTIEHGTDPQLTTATTIATFFGVTVEAMWPARRNHP